MTLTAAGRWIVSRVRGRTAVTRLLPSSNGAELLPVLPAADLYAMTGAESLLTTVRSKCGFSAEHFARTVIPFLNAYADFVQQLPAIGSSHRALPGGLLVHSLEMADLALTFRRGQILPKGAAPEDILRLEHRWTYAVLIAALMHGIGERMSALHVILHRAGSKVGVRWQPLSGSIADCGALRYSFQPAEDDRGEQGLEGKLPVVLYQRLVPAEALGWLSQDHELTGELIAILAGAPDAGAGAIAELVLRAVGECSKPHRSPGPQLSCDTTRRSTAMQGTSVGRAGSAPREFATPAGISEAIVEEVEARADESAANLAGSATGAPAHTAQLVAPISLPSAEACPRAAQAFPSRPSETALRFMAWLKAGLAQGTIRYNESGAMVHFVTEGMLLVSPRLFKQFANVAGAHLIDPTMVSREPAGLHRAIQDEILNAKWQVRGEDGRSILNYRVLRGGKPHTSICGVVIAKPERFVQPIPPANPHLLRAEGSCEG